MTPLPRKQEQYRVLLIACGCSEAEAIQIAQSQALELAALKRGECPSCGAAITRKLDTRQAGYKCTDQAWFNYRCGCGYMVDVAE